jgi:4-hydroxy-2-oxoheptanedioate aldolase
MFGSRQSYGVPDYFEVANRHTLLMVLIEDIVAVRNLDEILEVDHIDVFFVAPSDLAASMGHIGDMGHPDVQRTIDDALARIQRRQRVAGTLTDKDNVARYAAAGVQFLFTNIAGWINDGAQEFMRRSHGQHGKGNA